MLTLPLYSAATAGLLIVLQILLLLDVVRMRWRVRQSIGDGGKKDLTLAIRRHGNLAENAAIFIACFTLLELIEGHSVLLGVLCIGFLLGRLSHVAGLFIRPSVNYFRTAGVVLTVATGLVLGARLALVGLSHFF